MNLQDMNKDRNRRRRERRLLEKKRKQRQPLKKKSNPKKNSRARRIRNAFKTPVMHNPYLGTEEQEKLQAYNKFYKEKKEEIKINTLEKLQNGEPLIYENPYSKEKKKI